MRVFLISLSLITLAPVAPPLALASLPPGITTIDGIDENLGSADLAPIRRAIGNSSVVALGESIHSSKGYLQAKFRLTRFLIEELGFRHVSFENPWQYGMIADEFARGCKGTAKEAMEAGFMFPNWYDSSLASFLQWVCDYNRKNPLDPVRITGFDVQNPGKDRIFLTNYLARALPTDAPLLTASLATCPVYGAPRPTAADLSACAAGAGAARATIQNRKAEAIAKTSATEYGLALIALDSLESVNRIFQSGLSGNLPGTYEARDKGMAANFLALRDLLAPGAKSVIWAHNGHIAKEWEEALPVTHKYYTAKVMGSFLKSALGDEYFSMALLAYRVETSKCQEKVGGRLGAPLTFPLSIEFHLNKLAVPYLYVDLPAAAAPFDGLMDIVNHTWQQQILAKRQYSGIFFMQSSAGADLWTSCP